MTPTASQPIPVWVLVYLGLTTVMTIAISVLAYTQPKMLFDGLWPAAGAPGAFALVGPRGFFLSRDVATAVIDLYALKARTAGTVRMALLMRLASDTMDGVHFGVSGQSVVLPAVLVALSVGALWAMRRLPD